VSPACCPCALSPFHRGKLLNVRDASAAQITGNAEIQNIKQILGLQVCVAANKTVKLQALPLRVINPPV
jgi:DNA gyrase/topoisomerase IV subunit B